MCGHPQSNIDFYAGLLGLRLVKVTVNFDDPGTYHLYYGDGLGSPGTLITFFPWPRSIPGVHGNGEVAKVAFTVPANSLEFWETRLREAGVAAHRDTRFGNEEFLAFADHDGMLLELVASASPGTGTPWAEAGIEPEFAISGFHHAELWIADLAPTEQFLNQGFGAVRLTEETNRVRMKIGEGKPNQFIDLVHLPGKFGSQLGKGIVHHIAMRVERDEQQVEWQRHFDDMGLRATPVQERDYFRSIYLREPGRVLFEMATDGPGFAIDEPIEALATGLKLPDWIEPRRSIIEEQLLPIKVPAGVMIP